MSEGENEHSPRYYEILERWGPSGLLVVVAVAIFSSVLPSLASRLPAPYQDALHGDIIVHLWQYFWLDRFLEGGVSLFRTNMFFFPAEVDLTTLWEGHLDLLLAAPFVWLLGEVVTSNIVAFLFALGAALAVWWMAAGVTGDRWSSAAAASLFLLCPPVLHELAEGRGEVLSTALLALVLLYLRRWFLQGRVRHLVLTGLFIFLSVLGYLALGPVLLLLLPVLLLGAIPSMLGRTGGELADWARPRVFARRGVLLAVVLLLAALPLLAFALRGFGMSMLLGPLTGSSVGAEQAREWLTMSQHNSHELLSPFVPWLMPETCFYPGVGPLLPFMVLLAIVGPWRCRGVVVWSVGALVFTILSLGASIQLDPAGPPLELPYRFLPWVLPFFHRFHHPYRLLLIAAMFMVVPAAMVLAGLRRRVAVGRPWQPALLLLVPALAAAQGFTYFPLPTVVAPQAGEVHSWLAQDNPTAVIVAIHRAGEHHWNELEVSPLLAQLGHGAPICCLSLPASLQPVELRQALREVPLLAMLTGPIADIDGFRLPPGNPGDHGFSHLVLYVEEPKDLSAEQLHRMKEASLDQVGIGPCPACDHLVQRFGPPKVIENLERSHLSVFRIDGK